MKWGRAMLSKRAALLLLVLLPGWASCQSPQPSPVELLTGTWETSGVAFADQTITVQRGYLDIGDCGHIRYKVIRDQPGYGNGPENRRSGHVWRAIALELAPSNAEQTQCLQWKVLQFSIPADMRARADIDLFKTRTDFEKKPELSDWGVWIKMK